MQTERNLYQQVEAVPHKLIKTRQSPLVIPIFIPHSGCPHHCAFCNQTIITNEQPRLPDSKKIEQEVAKYLKFKGKREKVQLAFFGGTFLGLEQNQIKELLDCAEELVKKKKIESIRFSTRPDTITRESLEFLKNYSVTTIELGVQSMDNRVLSMSKRGHTSAHTRKAMALLKEYKFETGLQIMVGLPCETHDIAIKSARETADLAPDFIRIYPLIILNKSLVHKWYLKGQYTPLSLDECVTLVKEIFLIFNKKSIPVIRMGLQASEVLQNDESMVAGPWHPAFGHLVFSEIFLDKTLKILSKTLTASTSTNITLEVNPVSESRLRGDKNYNLKKLRSLYPNTCFNIKTNPKLTPGQITIHN